VPEAACVAISLLSPLEEFVYCCHEQGGGPAALLLPAAQAREVVAGLGTALVQLAALLVHCEAEGQALEVLAGLVRGGKQV
jgi:hypothetical protein